MNPFTKTVVVIFLTTFSLASCKSSKEEEKNKEEETFVQKTEKAHHKEAFSAKEAIQFDIQLFFGGKERMNATMTLLTNSSKGLIVFKNGAKIIADHDKVYYSPDVPSEKSVRFDAYTWSYFFLFPYKMSDGGTKWENYENKESDHEKFDSQRLTFEAGTGDAPDDWYVVYTNKATNLIEKAAYIVTANKNKEEAEKNPHAIKYTDYKTIDGIPVATKWSFWEWATDKGLTEEIGNATLTNIKFIKVDANTFAPGSDFKTI
ncbi:hypothetical protein [Flavobacterium sp. UMI-01]|uniref:hypothetical protein n=1 Tax=Flavobacterium sp. UMI-01 TaxID=1441053 RepID=UPI00207DD1A3|nr:hypothetical protein [Flavobacterium sp. UMI-01]GIZ10154.1 hypothetical protein FUMI01_28800 [Flavobacterium sp. UMI-01]